MGALVDEALETAAAESILEISEFTSPDLSLTAWSMSKVGFMRLHAADSTRGATAPKSSKFDPQGLSNAEWSFGVFAAWRATVFGSIVCVLMLRIEAFNAQNLSNTSWSFAVLGAIHERVMHVALLADPLGIR